MSRRVVITGLGIVSCLGNSTEEVASALHAGKSGIRYQEPYQECGMRSHVAGGIELEPRDHIERKHLRFMGPAAIYAYVAAQQAIRNSGLSEESLRSPRTGLIAGSGGGAPQSQIEAMDLLRARGLRRVGPYRVTQTMSSTVSACLATSFGIRGVNYSISSACATSAHCIGNAMELIQAGKQDVILAGGGEEESYQLSMLFDAMGALSTRFNEAPERASRPYDRDRDGFVIAGGGGIVVLEALEHAKARGATIYCELTGFGATSDGADMVAPSGEGAVACMQQCLETMSEPVDYINAHGTSTPAGDIVELQAIGRVFGDDIPPISSTKSLSGHSLGAAGVHELIYCLLMMEGNFISATANGENPEPAAQAFPIVFERRDNFQLDSVLSNSFGFGGTNACLGFQRYRD